MVRVLIGWELGGNRGHISRVVSLAQRLRSKGHEVDVALQRIDSGVPDLPAGARLWQAPLWPRLIANVARYRGMPATMGDILFRLGLDRPETLGALVLGWESILSAVKPDVVIADFAPALLCAAQERAPTIGIGNGFDQPPATLDSFPSLSGSAPLHDEALALRNANEGLKRAGRAPLAALPALFTTDVPLASTFAEVDPYAACRPDPVVAPAIPRPLPPEADGSGEEVFVYGVELMRPESKLWTGLQAAGLPVRVHVPNALPVLGEALRGFGFAFEPQPLPWAEIVRRSRLVVSHGGHGFVCSALVAGLPQVVTHFDLEKRGQADALVRAQLGGSVPLAAIRSEPFAASLRKLYEDDAFAARVRAAVPSFRARCEPSFEDEVTRAAARLA